MLRELTLAGKDASLFSWLVSPLRLSFAVSPPLKRGSNDKLMWMIQGSRMLVRDDIEAVSYRLHIPIYGA